MSRKKLPNRRPCLTETLDVEGRRYDVSYGYHPDSGELGEIFITGRGKVGGHTDHELYAAGTFASYALQSGATAEGLARSVEAAGHTSVMGAALANAPKL